MTKAEAIQAMKDGKKVTHRYFSSEEWMTMENGEVVLEDGIRCTHDEYWRWRTNPWWNDGYSLYAE